ncbi:MAG: peptidoglycan DD-metalloendopeptidase family protein [Oscillospiraceae bacterium]|nr:peptidoglycan DD-metalloendopeptidase family protein [Oscillospiraceae bacterium]MDY4190851.1 peptidoglycan DD-metalloendopeptidase family protein [Oscillospiraceae bacterium]
MKGKKALIKTISTVAALSVALVSQGGSFRVSADETAQVYSQVSAGGLRDDDYKSELADLNSQYAELQKEQDAINASINKAKSEKEKQLAVKKELDGQIYLTRQQIQVLEEKISLLNDNIEEKEIEIIDKQADIDDNYTLFKKRVRAMYMSGDSSTMGLILGADDFYDFLTRAEVLSRIAEHDRELIERLQKDKADIEEAKAEIEADRADLEGSVANLDGLKSTLSGQLEQTQKQIQDISALEEQFLKDKAKNQQEMAAVQADIDDIYAKLESMGDYVGGEFLWPVPGYSNITSYYGWRFNNSDFHTGIDISGANVYGKKIVAANSGKVVFVQRSYTPGKGYGIYLIIDHGGGMSTLYGHTSEILVDVGDYVTRGETIAKVGSTGWSTGPHLHFEIRVNGKHTNPLEYL